MQYNRDINQLAPFPSGPLPTEKELQRLIKRSRHRQAMALNSILKRVFRI